MAGEIVAHQPNLVLRNGTFHLQIRNSFDVVEALGCPHIVRSLRTKERKLAFHPGRRHDPRQETRTTHMNRGLISISVHRGVPGF